MRKIFSIAALALLVAGCGGKQEKPSEPYMAIVDGKPITADYVRGVVLVRLRMAELSGMSLSPTDRTNWMNSCGMMIIPGLVSAELLEKEAIRDGVRPDADDYAKTLANCNGATGQNAKTMEEIAAKFGEAEAAFRVQFERSALFMAYNRRHAQPPATNDDLPAFYADLTNKIENAKLIDDMAHKKADAALKRLEAGEEWDVVAKDCSEDSLVDEENEEFARDWATVGLDGMGYPELAKALPSLKKGEWSKPLETDEGLLIVKVNDVLGESRSLARILFRMAQPVDVPSDEAAALAEIDRQRKQSADEALMARLAEKATVTYPLGERFSYKLWR